MMTINGQNYTAAERASLPAVFRRCYGEDSFEAELADFLNEWYGPGDLLSVHTSGSTGTPKELWVEKRRMVNSARLTIAFLDLRRGDSALLCMPLRYIAGKMVVVRAAVGGLNLLPVTPCGHPLARLDEVPTFAALIPMQVYNTLQVPAEAEKLRQVRHLIIGGGAIDTALAEQLATFPNHVWSTYGMTETLSHIALRRLNGPEASEWYTPFDTVRLRLSAEGTLVIEAPAVSPETLVTNDLAELDHQGRFRILGRKDNTINTGGVKVQIEQVEALLRPLLPFPFLVTSVPDPKFGERIVLLAETDTLPSDGQLTTAFAQLPPYWRPRQVFLTGQLPLTETGKPDRATAKAYCRAASSTC